jgi:hypothetical protein
MTLQHTSLLRQGDRRGGAQFIFEGANLIDVAGRPCQRHADQHVPFFKQ